jgi:hypothetical protein
MSSTHPTGEERRLHDIARQYRSLGYKVAVSPSAKQLPRFLSKFRPDILAERPDESVVVEVKSSSRKRGTDYWRALTRVIGKHPGWRVELVVDGPSQHEIPQTINRDIPQTINKELVIKRLQEGRLLAEQGLLAASLLITWSALEAAMRLASSSYEIDLPDLRPGTVISRLYTDGVIEREEYDFLLDCMEMRNAVAHGFYKGKVRRVPLKKLEDLALRLLQSNPPLAI